MFTVAVVEDDETAVAKLRACLDRYAETHAGVQFDVTVFGEPTSFLNPYSVTGWSSTVRKAVACAVGFDPTACGFGDRCSTC